MKLTITDVGYGDFQVTSDEPIRDITVHKNHFHIQRKEDYAPYAPYVISLEIPVDEIKFIQKGIDELQQSE